MDPELIRSWLQLPAGAWPPDHYTLLGLNPGEEDVVRIEQRVHERMQKLRPYQMLHPEVATDAMNRLAQALICLTDPMAKKAYDVVLFQDQIAPPAELETPALEPAAELPELVEAPPEAPLSIAEATGPLAWLFGPWSSNKNRLTRRAAAAPRAVKVDETTATDTKLPSTAGEGEEVTAPTGTKTVAETPTSSQSGTAVAEVPAGQESERRPDGSRRGLETKRALYYRIARTRQLLWSWEQAGKYLNPPRRLKRPSEATELIHHMQSIHLLLQTFPPLLGQAGQPGYLVLALARQRLMVPMLQTLLPSQREALARDWLAGYNLLSEHRQFLRHELRALRKRNRLAQGLRTSWGSLCNHPGLVLLLVGLVALNLALPDLREMWPNQLLAFAILFICRLTWWWLALKPTKLPARPPQVLSKRRSKPTRAVRQPNSSRV